jgi:AraC-like DNA-binding protein
VTPKDWLHAAPFLLHFANTLTGELFGYYLIPGYVWVLPFPTFELISLCAYCVASWRLTSGELRRFIVVVAVVETIILFTIMLMIRNNPHFPDVRWLFVSLTLLVYWISYKLFANPGLFEKAREPVSLKPIVTTKYAHSGLKSDEADRIEALIREAVFQQHVFLDPGFSVDVFAKDLKVPRHHLSRVINERFGKSFNELANGWRLEEARARLTDPKHKDLTISTIAYDCGFSSISSFNTMFRKKFGTTPSAYRNMEWPLPQVGEP